MLIEDRPDGNYGCGCILFEVWILRPIVYFWYISVYWNFVPFLGIFLKEGHLFLFIVKQSLFLQFLVPRFNGAFQQVVAYVLVMDQLLQEKRGCSSLPGESGEQEKVVAFCR